MFGHTKGTGHTPPMRPQLENRGANLKKINNKTEKLNKGAAGFAQAAGELAKAKRAKAFSRKAKPVHAERVPNPDKSEIGGKDLSSRKIVWLEKFKHRFNIFTCNVSLKLHFYRGQEARAALKKSRDESKSELAILTNEEAMKTNTSKMKEELADGQYLQAAKRAGAASEAAIKAGKGRIESWWARV
ncbi:hypothetical protein [Endozoicomonas sp. YOMI1]|uniref:hypothetical protein n=1 Tax=Endozoicomonas sp. YOMI1 TaxID=2828739 RepID=UPI0021475703|nr:hypothetical protein [Endozoicomonas sp. YOMI1]